MNTAKRHVRANGQFPMRKRTREGGKTAGIPPWLRDEFLKDGGNADVVRQFPWEQRKTALSLRRAERPAEPCRDESVAVTEVTVRFI